jgi:hypothetical protein
MSAVVLQPGTYWLGDPKLVNPNWTPVPSCTYSLNGYTFHAFEYASGVVAAIPKDALPDDAWETINMLVLPDVVVVDTVTITKSKGKKSAAVLPAVVDPVYKQVRRMLPQFANTLTTFEEDTVFHEQCGYGSIGGIAL